MSHECIDPTCNNRCVMDNPNTLSKYEYYATLTRVRQLMMSLKKLFDYAVLIFKCYDETWRSYQANSGCTVQNRLNRCFHGK